jgi:hypothetical protein
MPSPQLNLRVPLEHHDLLRAVAARLREDAAFRDHLAALIAGVAAPVADPVAAPVAGVAAPVAGDSVTAHLEALEERVAALEEREPRMTMLEALAGRVAHLEARLERGTGQEAPQPVVEGAGEALEASEALEPGKTPREAPGGPQTRRKWTPEDDAALHAIASRGGSQADAGQELGRPSSVINAKWKALGLPVPPRKGRKLTRRQSV